MFTFLSNSIVDGVKTLWGMVNNYGIYDDVVYSAETFIPQDVWLDTENNLRKEVYLGLVKLSEVDDDFTAEELINHLRSKYPNDSEVIQELETFTQKYFPEIDDPFFVPKISGYEYKNLVNTIENHFVDARHCLAELRTVPNLARQCLAATTITASFKTPFEIISNTASYIYNHPTEILLNGLMLSSGLKLASRYDSSFSSPMSLMSASTTAFGLWSSVAPGVNAVPIANTLTNTLEQNDSAPTLMERSINKRTVNEDFLINAYTTNIQSYPFITSLTNGNFVVAWMSYSQDGSGSGVYGQVFTAYRSKSGSAFFVNTYTASEQGYQAITSLTNGNFVVVWASAFQDGPNYGVYGQVFTADGSKTGSEFLVNTYTTNSQNFPSIASLTNGNFVVVWESAGQDGSGYGVYGQVFTANGSKSGSEFLVNTYTTNSQSSPSLTSLTNGNFIVVWASDGQDGSSSGIYGQLFIANGSKSGSEFLVNTYTTNSQSSPSITSLTNGNFVVVWESGSQDGSNNGVYGQVFIASGSKTGVEFPVNTYTTDYQGGAAITSLTNGNFVVVWNSNLQDGSDYGVYGQVFTVDANKIGSEFLVNTYTTNSQSRPSITSLMNGNFVITWDGAGSEDTYGIYGKVFGTYVMTVTNTSQSINYIEDTNYNFADIVITSALPVSAKLTFANLLAGNFTIGTSGAVTSTYNEVTGVWQAVGEVNDVNALLANVQFVPTLNFNNNFTIGVNIDNGFSDPITNTITVIGIPVNDSPVLSGVSAVTYTENAAEVIINNAITVTDVDSSNLFNATISINVGLNTSQDALSFTPSIGITGSYNSNTGVLTLSGTSGIANYQSVLRSITFINSSENPTATTRQVSFIVNDGDKNSAPLMSTVGIDPVNDAPVVFNIADVTVVPENTATVIDSSITVSDVDSSNLKSAIISIVNGFSSDDILSFTNQNGITGSYNSATGVLTLSGNASLANYQAALRSVTYLNTADNPSVLAKTIAFIANDGGANSNTITRNLTLTLINDAPLLTGISQVSYTENSAPVIVNSGLLVSDPDTPNLTNATVSIRDGFVNSEDQLELASTSNNGIVGQYDNITGVFILSGQSNIANYQAVLRNITYINYSENPNATTRQISFVVSDGDKNSIPLISTVIINPVNDAPNIFVFDDNTANFNYIQNDLATVILRDIVLTDVDDNTMQSATISISDGFAAGEDVLDFINQNNGIQGALSSLNRVLTLSGPASIVDYQIVLSSVTYRNVAASPTLQQRIMSFTVNDGIEDSNILNRTVNVLLLNDTANPSIGDKTVADNTSTLLAILLPIAGTAICAIAGSLVGLYLWRRYRIKKHNEMELSSIRQNKFTIVGGRFALINRISIEESAVLEQQTGIKVTFVKDEKKTKFVLGQGQFGKLRLARDINTKQYVGVKKIKGDNQIAASEKEAGIQKKLSDLLNIMPLIESLNITDAAGKPVLYQFMPLAGFGNGEVLTKYLQESADTVLRDKILIHVMKSLLIACQGMHSRHVYHNDLKPSNFVIDQKGNVFIIDFGCAVESIKPMMSSVIGDTGYFSPDRLLAYKDKHQFNAAKSDAWALGVTMLEIMLGRYPFDKDTAELRVRFWNALYFQDKFKEISELQNLAPNSLLALIKGLLEINPDNRLSIEAALQHPALNNRVVQFSSVDEISVGFKLLQGSNVEDSKAPVIPTKSVPKDENSDYIHPEAIVNSNLYNPTNTSVTANETMQPSPYPMGNDDNDKDRTIFNNATSSGAMLKSPYLDNNENIASKQSDVVVIKALRTAGIFAQTSRAAANEPVTNQNRYSHTQTDLQQQGVNVQQH